MCTVLVLQCSYDVIEGIYCDQTCEINVILKEPFPFRQYDFWHPRESKQKPGQPPWAW